MIHLLLLDCFQTLLDEHGQEYQGLIGWPSYLVILEEDLSPEECEGFINDVILLSIRHFGSRPLEISFQGQQGDAAS